MAYAPPVGQASDGYALRVSPGQPVTASELHYAKARAAKNNSQVHLKSLLLFFAFWLFAATLFLFLYISRLT